MCIRDRAAAAPPADTPPAIAAGEDETVVEKVDEVASSGDDLVDEKPKAKKKT